MAECSEKKAVSGDKGTRYDDPVYKKISLLNGEVNRLTKSELQDKLESYGLDTRGVKDVLKKRLKNYYKKKKLAAEHVKPASSSGPFYEYILVIDFEATCNEHNPHKFKHEIIEFPIVLVDTAKLEIVDTFQSYCRPRLNPKLSEFCSKLTGITQDTVNSAPSFREVLSKVEDWLEKHHLNKNKPGNKFAVLSDGPYDFSRFLYSQCLLSRLRYPRWTKKWINIKKCYSNYYSGQRSNLQTMLDNLGMSFEGRQHCGLDDAKNIARVAIRMLDDGAELRVNERIFSHRLQKLNDQVPADADVRPISKEDAELTEESESSGDESFENGKENEKVCDSKDCAHNVFVGKDVTCEGIEQSFKKLIIDNPELACGSETNDGDGISDLISYFKLQKN